MLPIALTAGGLAGWTIQLLFCTLDEDEFGRLLLVPAPAAYPKPANTTQATRTHDNAADRVH